MPDDTGAGRAVAELAHLDLAAAVNEGSASAAFDPDVAVAGKTGTCEQLGWFASYAPADDPQEGVVAHLQH